MVGPILLVLLPFLVKLPQLAGLLRSNPLLSHSGLQVGMSPGRLGGTGLPTIDPNIAFTSQALGHRAALDVLGGSMPWWNPFEGVGAPLAGEMQSAALFPLTALLAWQGGQLYEHLALQIIAGLATYALLRLLGLRRLPAFAGAAVFAFNGAFAWLGNAVINPIAFLPVLLLGIEAAAVKARQGRPGGGAWIVVGLAGSLYAGFPEVAYLDGLLAAAWTLWRAATLPAGRSFAFVTKVALGGLAGLLVAAPILVAFGDYLPLAEVGAHAGTGFLAAHLDPSYLVMLAVPYLMGGIFAVGGQNAFWGNVGGYAGCALLVLAFAGLLGRRHLALRLLLAGWVVVALGITFGVPWLQWLVRVVPGLQQTALYRYLPASWLMCLCVLAALALDDLAAGRRRGWAIVVGALLLGGLAAAQLSSTALPILTARFSRSSLAAGAAVLVALLALALVRRLSDRARAASLTGVLLAETLLWFMLPTLTHPWRGSLELAGVRFLQAHLGLQRFATLGPIEPNYGAYFAIASINHNDLPIPRDWVAYVRDHLDANAVPIVFNGNARADPAGPSATQALLARQAAYAAIGVAYIVAPLGQEVPGLAEVFRDRAIRIYELPGSAPYVSAVGCRLDVRDRNRLTADCEVPSRLVRLELMMPGWRAWVGNQPADLATTAGIFQAVALPAGTSAVRFAFEPPFMAYGYAAFATGMVLLLFGLWRDQKPQATVRSLPRIRLR